MARSLTTAHVVAAALGGIGTGFFLRALVLPVRTTADPVAIEAGAQPSSESEARETELVLPANRASAGKDSEPEAPAAAGRSAVDADSGALISGALLEHTRDGVQRGWASLRADELSEDAVEGALETFREITLDLGEQLGRGLAREADARDQLAADAERGGAFALLASLDDGGGGPLPEVVKDKETFDGFFPAVQATGTYDALHQLTSEQLAKRQPVPDGSVLTFPSGVFHLDDLGRYWSNRFPEDLTIRGAGMNSTLLVLRSSLSSRSQVSNLRIEGATIHAENHYLFDVRGEAMLLTMDGVRVLGWTSSGGGCAFGSDTTMLRASNCEFLGGYSRSAEAEVRMFDIRTDGMLARFEGCLFSRVQAFEKVRSGATVVYDRCRIEDGLGETTPPANFFLLDTPVTAWNANAGQSLARDLNDLFPDWKAELQK